MSGKSKHKWYLISGKEAQKLLEDYRQARSLTFKKAKAFAKKYGADTKNIWHIDDGGHLKITGFDFKEHPGDLWKKVKVNGRPGKTAYMPTKLAKSKELRTELEKFQVCTKGRELHSLLSESVGWTNDVFYTTDQGHFVSTLNFFWVERGDKLIGGFRAPNVPEDKNKYKNVKEIQEWEYHKLIAEVE